MGRRYTSLTYGGYLLRLVLAAVIGFAMTIVIYTVWLVVFALDPFLGLLVAAVVGVVAFLLSTWVSFKVFWEGARVRKL